MKGSSAIPIFYRKYIKLNDIDYIDGGLADPIPVLEAYRRKTQNIMVIRSRPYSYTLNQNRSNYWQRLFLKESSKLIEAFSQRA